MKDYAWAQRAPRRFILARPKGEPTVDLATLPIADVRKWVEVQTTFLDDLKVDLRDYLSEREADAHRKVAAFRKQAVVDVTVKESKAAREASGVSVDGLRTACGMILSMKLSAGAVTQAEHDAMMKQLENGGTDVVAVQLGIGFKR